MVCRAFEGQDGRTWIITRKGSRLTVMGRRGVNDSLYTIAISCALKLGLTETKKGTPVETIKEHNRIWKMIWDKGRSC